MIVPLSYLIAHSIMWCTIWACAYLPDLTFASDGFIIIMAIFIFFGFAAPGKWSVIFTGLIFLDIGVANTFLHYPELLMMLILAFRFMVESVLWYGRWRDLMCTSMLHKGCWRKVHITIS